MDTDQLKPASSEQLDIINCLSDYNVIVDAVAGSGKTTTILHIALKYNVSILNLTYNRKLKDETNIRAMNCNLTNLECCTYHGFCRKYLNMTGYTDFDIDRCLRERNDNNLGNWGIIIIDEAQDITFTYYKVIKKILLANIDAKICILGDRYQSIYQFNDADPRFIIYADQIFNYNRFEWVRKNLSTSYRLTNKMADFLNHCVLGIDRIKTVKEGKDVSYICTNLYSDQICNLVIDIIKKCKYRPDDIFILAPSVRPKLDPTTKNPIQKLANTLTNHGIPILIPNNDNDKISEKVSKGKLLFSSFHQTKGLERKLVIVLSFDTSYFEFYNRHDDINICPNIIYVALTRATYKLIVVHHNGPLKCNGLKKNGLSKPKHCLPFLKINKLSQYANIVTKDDGKCLTYGNVHRSNSTTYMNSVTNLIRHIPFNIQCQALNLLEFTTNNKNDEISFNSVVAMGKLWESVSDIIGIAIPIFYQLKQGKIPRELSAILDPNGYKEEQSFLSHIIEFPWAKNRNLTINDFDILKDASFQINDITIPKVMKLANFWQAYESRYYFKLRQIFRYNWLEDYKILQMLDRLEKHISPNAIFEYHVTITKPINFIQNKVIEATISGYIDVIDGDNVWELKCTKNLSEDHKLQLACYYYLLESENPNPNRHYYLYNIRTDECLEIKSNELEKIFNLLVINKLMATENKNDNEFFNMLSLQETS